MLVGWGTVAWMALLNLFTDTRRRIHARHDSSASRTTRRKHAERGNPSICDLRAIGWVCVLQSSGKGCTYNLICLSLLLSSGPLSGWLLYVPTWLIRSNEGQWFCIRWNRRPYKYRRSSMFRQDLLSIQLHNALRFWPKTRSNSNRFIISNPCTCFVWSKRGRKFYTMSECNMNFRFRTRVRSVELSSTTPFGATACARGPCRLCFSMLSKRLSSIASTHTQRMTIWSVGS